LEKAGFTKEGLLRRYYFKDDKPTDGLMWAMIKDDWEALKKLQQQQ